MIWGKYKIWQNNQIWDKYQSWENCQLSLYTPPGPKRNFGKPKAKKLEFELEQLVIWTLGLATSAAF